MNSTKILSGLNRFFSVFVDMLNRVSQIAQIVKWNCADIQFLDCAKLGKDYVCCEGTSWTTGIT